MRRQFVTWLLLALPFVYVALFRLGRRVALLLMAAAALVAYHLLFTLGIMAYHARFFMPALLPVVLAGCIAWPSFAGAPGFGRRVWALLIGWPVSVVLAARFELLEQRGIDDPASWISVSQYLLFAAPTLLLVLSPLMAAGVQRCARVAVPLLALGVCAFLPWHKPPAWSDDAIEAQTAVGWPGLGEAKRCLAEPIHLYHSELGLPGVMFLHSRITDLSGLMNPEIAYGREQFDATCLRDPPALLFLPHRTHRHFNERIAASRCIQLFVPVTQLPASSAPLYVRRDLFDAFERCLDRND